MATQLRAGLWPLLVLLREAPPPRPLRQGPTPPPFPREGPGIGAAPQGLRPDSRTLSRGAPYKGIVGAERATALDWPRPQDPPPASEGRSSAPPQDHLSRAGYPYLKQCERERERRPRLSPVSPQGAPPLQSPDAVKSVFRHLPGIHEKVKRSRQQKHTKKHECPLIYYTVCPQIVTVSLGCTF